jgi:hypothetical protein
MTRTVPDVCSFTADRVEGESAAIICSSKGRTGISHGEVRRKFRPDIKAVCSIYGLYTSLFIILSACRATILSSFFFFSSSPSSFSFANTGCVKALSCIQNFQNYYVYVSLDVRTSSVPVWTSILYPALWSPLGKWSEKSLKTYSFYVCSSIPSQNLYFTTFVSGTM